MLKGRVRAPAHSIDESAHWSRLILDLAWKLLVRLRTRCGRVHPFAWRQDGDLAQLLRAVALKEVLDRQALLSLFLLIPVHLILETPERPREAVDHELVEEEETHAGGDKEKRLRALQQLRSLVSSVLLLCLIGEQDNA